MHALRRGCQSTLLRTGLRVAVCVEQIAGHVFSRSRGRRPNNKPSTFSIRTTSPRAGLEGDIEQRPIQHRSPKSRPAPSLRTPVPSRTPPPRANRRQAARTVLCGRASGTRVPWNSGRCGTRWCRSGGRGAWRRRGEPCDAGGASRAQRPGRPLRCGRRGGGAALAGGDLVDLEDLSAGLGEAVEDGVIGGADGLRRVGRVLGRSTHEISPRAGLRARWRRQPLPCPFGIRPAGAGRRWGAGMVW